MKARLQNLLPNMWCGSGSIQFDSEAETETTYQPYIRRRPDEEYQHQDEEYPDMEIAYSQGGEVLANLTAKGCHVLLSDTQRLLNSWITQRCSSEGDSQDWVRKAGGWRLASHCLFKYRCGSVPCILPIGI